MGPLSMICISFWVAGTGKTWFKYFCWPLLKVLNYGIGVVLLGLGQNGSFQDPHFRNQIFPLYPVFQQEVEGKGIKVEVTVLGPSTTTMQYI